VRAAADEHAATEQHERDQDRDDTHTLRVGAGPQAPIDIEEVRRREREQPERPPADPGRGDQQRSADRAGADHADHAYALVGVNDSGAIQLGGAQP
jgi:hypothetical protein